MNKFWKWMIEKLLYELWKVEIEIEYPWFELKPNENMKKSLRYQLLKLKKS